ncbi:unannotated protein [freshwater metagenome]|uniref:Unannotated protein n=1 Tax=freshwater metagenome TaxID=449393 RepID=A0A6J6WH64_9ZZZZ
MFPSTKAKPSKSRSIPSNEYLLTRSTIDLTIVILVSGFARYPDKTSFSVPSVIVGINLRPLLRIKQIVSAIGHEGFPVE